MKKIIFPLILLLAGCAVESPNQIVATHQPLQAIETEKTTAPASATETTSITFETQQEFVDYMYERVRSLEDTLALLNNNLTQIIMHPEDSSLSEIRQNLLDQTRHEKDVISNIAPMNDEVVNLLTYVVQSYIYNLEDKIAQYEIAHTESLEERQTLLDANTNTEHLASHYLGLAWEELNRLSETTFSRK